MAKVLVSDQYLEDIADAIRAKNGSQTLYTPGQMASAITAITSSFTLQSKTVSSSTTQQVVTPDNNYDGLSQVTVNAMPIVSQAIPQITVTTATGVITASAQQSAGYVEADTKTSTVHLSTIGTTAITPSSNDQYIAEGTFLTGLVTVKGLINGDNLTYGTSTTVTQALVTKTQLDALATTIKQKASSSTLPMTITQMQNAVASIRTSQQMSMQSKTVSPSGEMQVITADSGYDGLASVQVNAVNSSELTVSADGTYTPAAGNYYHRVVVNTSNQTQFNLQTKSVTPTTAPQSIVPDTGYNGLSSVIVGAIPGNYADVSDVDATISDVISGKTFVDATGTAKTGTLQVNSYYVGSNVPDSSVGSDGDLYLKI